MSAVNPSFAPSTTTDESPRRAQALQVECPDYRQEQEMPADLDCQYAAAACGAITLECTAQPREDTPVDACTDADELKSPYLYIQYRRLIDHG